MNVIGHQHVSIDTAVVLLRCLGKPGELRDVVVLFVERRLAVVAALDQVLRNFGKRKARPARHGGPARENVNAYNAWRPEKLH